MSTRGIMNTSNYHPDWRPRNFAERAWKEVANTGAILTGLLGANPQNGTVDAVDVIWRGQMATMDFFALGSALTAVAAGTTSNVTIANAMLLTPGDVFLVSTTGEQVRVQNVVSATTVVVRRGFNTPVYAASIGAQLIPAGNAFEESSLRPQMRSPNKYSGIQMVNKTQIFRNAHGESGTVRATVTGSPMPGTTNSGENQMAVNRTDAAYRHAQAQEWALLFSQMGETTQNGQPIRTMDGLFAQIYKYAPQNIVDFNGQAATWRTFQDALYAPIKVKTDMSSLNDRVLVTGRQGHLLIDRLMRTLYDKPRLDVSKTQFGLPFMEVQTVDGGNFKLVVHDFFNRMPGMSNTMLILDPGAMSYPTLPGRNGRYAKFNSEVTSASSNEADNGDSGVDAGGGDYLTEGTLKVTVPVANGIIKNMCDIALDPAPTVVSTKTLCVNFSHPCQNGVVEIGDIIQTSFAGGNVGQVIIVKNPEGTDVTVTLDANGAAVYNYTVPGTVLANQDLPFLLNVFGAGTTNNTAVLLKGATTYNACTRSVIAPMEKDTFNKIVVSDEPEANCA